MAEIPGSAKAGHPEARILSAADPSDVATVTIVPVNHVSAITDIVQFAHNHALRATVEHGLVKATGTVANLERTFGVSLHVAELPDGSRFRSRVPSGSGPTTISVPDDIAPHVVAILGLDNRAVAKPHFRLHPQAGPNAYTAAQVGQLYSFPSGNGSGRTVDIIELGGGYSTADITAAGGQPGNVTAVSVDGATNSYSGDPNSADGEVALDVQNVASIVPSARQRVYFAPNTDAGFLDAIAASVHASPPPDAVSISWGSPENSWTQSAMNAMDAMAAQAPCPVFAASGDGGSEDGTGSNVCDFPASGPHFVGCGGTVVNSASPLTESVWDDLAGGGGAGGGGVSSAFNKPTFQASINISGRGVPDVAGDAAPSTGYAVHIAGSTYQFGGTSAVAPLYSGLAALLVSSLGKALSGWPGALYPLESAFHDVTSGNNGGYSAGPGYDQTTGLGTPNGTALLAALQGSQPTPPGPGPTPPGSITLAQFDAMVTTVMQEVQAMEPTYVNDQCAEYQLEYGLAIAQTIKANGDAIANSAQARDWTPAPRPKGGS